MMLHLPLSVVILHASLAWFIAGGDDSTHIGDIAGLDGVHPHCGIEFHRIIKLRLVVGDVAAGFVVTDQSDAFGAGIVCNRLEIEIGHRLRKAELVAVGEPVAIPALVPAFDQHAAEMMFRGEVHVLLGARRGRAVAGAFRPCPLARNHPPPDADILAGLEP
jgi:hypothetical protein